MANDKQLPDWEAFEAEIDSLFEKVRHRRAETPVYVSPPLFRGLAAESWHLQTTLERYSTTRYTVEDYFNIMRLAKHAAESLTEKRWRFPPHFRQMKHPYLTPQAYEFMVYLRHHGFPSPLLDWTQSPYIAAFFAFQSKPPSVEENVSIYAYIQHFGYGISGSQHAVNAAGPTITTDRRHHIQQCWYTLATVRQNGTHVYCNHEEALASNEAVTVQNLLTKYLIPSQERHKVLAKLDFMNINAYSLFGDEDSLMKTLAFRTIEQKDF